MPCLVAYPLPLSNTQRCSHSVASSPCEKRGFFLVQLLTSYSLSAPNCPSLPPRAFFLNAQAHWSPCHDASYFLQRLSSDCFLHHRLQTFILYLFQYPRCSVMVLITFFLRSQVNWNYLNKHKRKKNRLPETLHQMASLVAQTVKNLPAVQEAWVWSLGQEDPLEKGIATHPLQYSWLENPMDRGACQSTGSQRVRRDWATNISTTIES